MREGWWKDDYLILFDEPEIASATARYGISEFLPGYEIVGLWWDDFLVRDTSGMTYRFRRLPQVLDIWNPVLRPLATSNLKAMIVLQAK